MYPSLSGNIARKRGVVGARKKILWGEKGEKALGKMVGGGKRRQGACTGMFSTFQAYMLIHSAAACSSGMLRLFSLPALWLCFLNFSGKHVLVTTTYVVKEKKKVSTSRLPRH
jgi:hypothetical protein